MSDSAEIKKCLRDIKELKIQLQRQIGDMDETPLQNLCSVETPQTKINLRTRKCLKGHFGKIYAMHWGGSGCDNKVVSASQDGKLIIWNATTGNKVAAIPLRSSWVMTCAYAASGKLVACGGLDNLCSVYQTNEAAAGQDHKQHQVELSQHEGYLSCCRFIGDDKILTSSGDSTCILWDIDKVRPIRVFTSHQGDVMSVSPHQTEPYFISGSCDASAKMWDFREGDTKSSPRTFYGHESDINSVQYFPDGNAFGTGSDDSACRLFDVRAMKSLNKYCEDKILCGITSVAFSRSGKMLFAGYDDYNCYVWDTLHGRHVQMLQAHENRVSCLGVNVPGTALCTGSWDTLLQIWA